MAVDADVGVIGYYVLVASRIERKKAPADLAAIEPLHAIPSTYLAAFAIDRRFQGRGYGSDLLLHAFITAANAARYVNSYAMDLHAFDDRARAFHVRHGFRPLGDPRRPNDLYILLQDIRRTLEGYGDLV
nr:GNAT family N-acetyltransferase [Actinoplanes lichenis]